MGLFNFLLIVHILTLIVSSSAGYENSVCETNSDCIEKLGLRNTICSEAKVCQCHSDFYLNPDTGHCALLHQRLHGPCLQDAHCTKYIENSWCKNEKCECSYGHFENSDHRSCTKTLGAQCEKEEDCAWKDQFIYLECNETTKTCECPQGKFYFRNTCYNLPDRLEYACNSNSLCESSIPNSHCREYDREMGNCKCNEGYNVPYNNTRCFKLNEIDCQGDDQICKLSDPLSICGANGGCECNEDSFHSPTESRCFPLPKNIRFDSCLEDSNCRLIPHSYCNKDPQGGVLNTCKCNTDYIPVDGMTKCELAIGKPCNDSWTDCPRTSYLVCGKEGTCECDQEFAGGFFFSKIFHSCVNNYKYCEEDVHCSGHENTECQLFPKIPELINKRRCSCKEGFEEFYTSWDKSICIETFGTCEESSECGQEYTKCFSDRNQTKKYCTCETNRSVELNKEMNEYFCQLPIYNECDLRNYPEYCADHLQNSYCKGNGDTGICLCDDENGYYYDSITMTCKNT